MVRGTSGAFPTWSFGIEEHEFESIETPEIAIDPDSGLLSLINTGSTPRTFFVTVENCSAIIGSDGIDLLALNRERCSIDYLTFICTVESGYMANLARLFPFTKGKRIRPRDLQTIKISSDVQEWERPILDVTPYDISILPLMKRSDCHGFLCTQSAGGNLTHFAHPSTYFAVDFRCVIGTPVMAVFDAVVVEIRNETDDSGIHVSNLFHWNSIMIKHKHSNIYAEYVHVKKDSFRVAVGDAIRQGDVICLSGEAGFCPEPHLHFELHSSAEAGNPSLPITYKGESFQVDQIYS